MFRAHVALVCTEGSGWGSERGQMWSRRGPAAPPNVSVCTNQGGKAWIGGVNGREATGWGETGAYVHLTNPIKGDKNNTETLSTAHLKGVQSSDRECLEQPFLMSFVHAGNINSS